MRSWQALGAVALLLLAGAAGAVQQEQQCRIDQNGQKICEPVTPPVTPVPVLPTVPVQAIYPSDTPPLQPASFGRWIYENSNGQTGQRPFELADIGGVGTEGNGPTDGESDCTDGGVGNPIFPATGNKIEREVEFATTGEMALALVRTWNQQGGVGRVFGSKWSSNFDHALEVAGDRLSIVAVRPDGARLRYVYRTAPLVAWYEERHGRSRIVAESDGGYLLYAPDNTLETYGAHGRITAQTNTRGVGLHFTYRAHATHWTPLLQRVTHTNGQSIQFTWTDTVTGPLMTRVLDPAGNAYTYAYDAYERLKTVVQPGTPGSTITYHYPLRDARLLGKSLDGARYSTFDYDAQGRATLSEHAGGVDRHTFAYTDNADGSMSVEHVNPLGKRTTSRYRNGLLLDVSGHASASCASAYRMVTYAGGEPDIVSDFNGNLTDFDYAQGLLYKKVEAAGTPEARTTHYEWDHAGRTTRMFVEGVLDTRYFYGGDGLLQLVIAHNASPHGYPMRAVYTEYTYTYHPNQLIASITLVDAGRKTLLTFDTMGRLVRRENALGHAMRWENFNALGQAGREIGINGETIDRTFDARGRVLSETSWIDGVARTTRFTYDTRGQLIETVTPEGVRTRNTYDAAGRLMETTRQAPAQAASTTAMSLSSPPTDTPPASDTLHFSAIAPMACMDCDYEERPGVPATIGHIDGIAIDANGDATLKGWACSPRWEAPVDVHLYVGGPAGIGTFVVATKANFYSEPAIGAQCGLVTSFHRFAIPLFDDFRRARRGQGLYVHALSPLGAPNPLLPNSGTITVPAIVDDAVFVAQSVPAVMETGRTYAVNVQMRNTGNTTWSAAKAYRLGSQSPGDNQVWGGHRVYLAADVAPGEIASFDFNVVAPTTAGGFPFHWRMLREGVLWFGAQSPIVDVDVRVTPAPPPPSPPSPPPPPAPAPAPIDFVRYSYNANSQVVSTQVGRIENGVATVVRTTTVEYDELGRVRVQRGNNGQSKTIEYDAEDHPLVVTDALGRRESFSYDALGRMVEHTDANWGKTRFTYDAADRIVEVIDPRALSTKYERDGFGLVLRQESPDSGVTTFDYYLDNTLHWKRAADGTTLWYGYDVLGRVTFVGTPEGGRHYTYDDCANGKGRLCATSTSRGVSSSFDYTAFGALRAKRESTFGSDDLTVSEFDGLGHVVRMRYPSGVAVRYAREHGEVVGAYVEPPHGAFPVATQITRDASGAVTGWRYGNGLERHHGFDTDGRVTAISVGDTQLVRQSLTYQQDAADRITRITNGIDAAATQTYAYDKLDRLVQENAQVYEYDANGNRWRSGAACHVEDTSNRLLQSGDLSFAYDANGNTTQWTLHGQTPVVTYDAFQRTQRITIDGTSHEYEYDALDQRVGKRAPSGAATRYFRDGHRLMAEVDAQGRWTTYVWLGDTLIGFVRDGGLYYVHTDHLGRPESVTAHDRSYVWRARNGAFGRDAVLVERVGAFNIGLPGQYFDAESGIWQNGRRDYAEATGRYLQTDPIGLRGGFNTYAYTEGNPVHLIDPFGLEGVGVGWTPRQMYDIGSQHGQRASEMYQTSREWRAWGHQTFPGERNSSMRHCTVSCILGVKLGNGIARTAGATNEVQGLLMHDIPNLRSRLKGDSAWACQAGDLASNEQGFKAASSISPNSSDSQLTQGCMLQCGQ